MKKEQDEMAEIKLYISETHKAFLSTNQTAIYKVDADIMLARARIVSKIIFIAEAMKEAGVIDKYSVTQPVSVGGPDSAVDCVVMKKNGLNNSMYVMTDGANIFARSSSFSIDFGTLSPFYEKFARVEDVDGYDWKSFASILLDFVYVAVYNKERARKVSILSDWGN